MGFLSRRLAQLDDNAILEATVFELDSWAGLDREGLEEAHRRLFVIRKLALQLDLEPFDEIPEGVLKEAVKSVDGLLAACGQMVSVEAGYLSSDNIEHLTQIVDCEFNRWRDSIRPHIRNGMSDIATRSAVLDEQARQMEQHLQMVADLTARVGKATLQSEELIEHVKTLAANAGAGTLSRYYGDQAARYGKIATGYFVATVLFTLALLIVGPILFYTYGTSANMHLAEVVHGISTRALVLGVVAYGTAFCVRNHRTNMHLRTVNERRRNALDTFVVFSESIANETTKQLMIVELVRSVFGSEETGYLDTTPERTFLQHQGDAVLALAGRAGPR